MADEINVKELRSWKYAKASKRKRAVDKSFPEFTFDKDMIINIPTCFENQEWKEKCNGESNE